MSFEECELAILRQAVDKVDKIEGEELLKNPEVKSIIEIVEHFLRKTKCVCYGGTAINALLPPDDQFYDPTTELPDYDFFSTTPMAHAKKLADIYYKYGFTKVEAKAGVHTGTFKVFVNFIPVADITYMVPELFKRVKKKAISKNGILYSPPNFLRMLMYLELSRPKGNPSRWEKVLKRISLLNKNYPLRGKHCEFVEIQRFFDAEHVLPKGMEQKIFFITRDSLMNQGVVFFGAMANQLYLRYLKKFKKINFKKTPDFDVLSEDPESTAQIVKERLEREGIRNVHIKKKKGVGEVIAPHYEVIVNDETILMIYKPLACHSYNMIRIKGRTMKVATIDTMLSLYLAFMYVDRAYYDPNRIICMAEYLFKVQQYNRLSQRGILKRFSINCYGEQETLYSIRDEKSEMYDKLKRGTRKWDYYFLKYDPSRKSNKKKNKTRKNKHSRKRKTRRRFFNY
jgi:hypothetical protein